MANISAEKMKNSCVKSALFAGALAFCIIIVATLWYNYPGSEKCSAAEEVDGVIIFKQLGLAFVYNPELLDWPHAHEACRSRQGHLAFPHSTAEAQGMMDIMKNNTVRAIHAGFHDMFVEKEYVTVLGESLKEVGYQVKMPDTMQGPEVNCGKMMNNALVSMKCSDRLPSICSYPMWHDYTPVPGFGYFKLHENATTWPKAWTTCRKEGSYLLILRSDYELLAMIQSLNGSMPVEDMLVHYGAYKIFSDVPITIFDEPLESSGYNFWDNASVATPTTPGKVEANDGNFSYVALRLRPSTLDSQPAGGLTLTHGVNVSLPFICKHNLH